MIESFKTILKEYDIRGKIGKELNEETAFKLGQLFSYNAHYKKVVIGRDNRKSSATLLNSFIKGLLYCGCEVIELDGVSTSPYLYFASHYLATEGAVMVTGSHNSLEDNGFKLLVNQKPFYGNALRNIVHNPISQGTGKHTLKNLRTEYIEALTNKIKIFEQKKIVWECNNSGNSLLIPSLNLPGNYLLLNDTTNGIFKHKLPDPFVEETLDEIKNVIRQNNYDYGFGFDGDGDRLRMLKPDGTALTSDQLIYLFALSLKDLYSPLLLSSKPSANISQKSHSIIDQPQLKIIVDVKASQILINKLREEGFIVVIAPSGHSLMKERIIEENAIFAGESSGHFYFNDGKYFAFDDALYAALRLIKYLEKNPLVELPLAKISKEYKIPKIQNLDLKVYTPEGLRIELPYGFLLIRASNTEEYILIKFESEN